MRRAAVATAIAASVLLIYVVTSTIASPVVDELSSGDGSPVGDSTTVDKTIEPSLPLADPAAIVLPGSAVTLASTTTRGSTPLAAAPTTTTRAGATTMTTASSTTTHTATPVSTTTDAPVATPSTTAVAFATTNPPPTTTITPSTTTTAVVTPPAPVASGSYSAAAEAEFLSRINGVRTSVGLAGVATNAELTNYARWWAKQMADSGIFSHSNIASLLDPWVTIGENLGYGPTVAVIFDKLVASPLHYVNIVDPRFTSVGIGAYVDSTGRIWTAHVFGQ